MRHHLFTPQPGFTLIELLVTISIMAILATATSVVYSRFLVQSAVGITADQIAEDLRTAQFNTIQGRQAGSWGVRYASSTLTLFQGTSYASRNTALDQLYKTNTALSIVGLNETVFARVTGFPSVTSTIVITGSNSSQTITVNSNGVVSR